jgi:hypothetical protein
MVEVEDKLIVGSTSSIQTQIKGGGRNMTQKATRVTLVIREGWKANTWLVVKVLVTATVLCALALWVGGTQP